MSSPTKPNRWLLLEAETRTGPVYKVFATWAGGYLDGDNWRLNSGVEKTLDHEDHYEFQGYSGSVYLCNKDSYGIAGGYNHGVLAQFIQKGFTLIHESELREKLNLSA